MKHAAALALPVAFFALAVVAHTAGNYADAGAGYTLAAVLALVTLGRR